MVTIWGLIRMRNLLVLVLIATILVIPVSYGLTASMGNARMILRPVVEEGKITEINKYIKVNNVNDIPINVVLEPDENYKKIIEVFDNEFVLQPDESKKAKFRITLKSGGNYEGRITVSFAPADPEVKDNSVGLASTIIILAEGPVTDEYYEVMKKEDEIEPVEEDTEEPQEPERDAVIENEETSEENTVSVSMGSKPKISEGELEAEGEGINPLSGILIMVIVIGAGLGIFFAVKKLSK